MRGRTTGSAGPWAVAAALLAFLPGGASGQSVRGWVGATVQAVELRPVFASDTACASGPACYLPGAEQRSVVGTQDLSVTAWGFGVTGLSFTTYVRGRANLGSEFVWPRANDHFDALLAYGQLVKGRWTARLGRQELRTGLGFSAFDGGRATLRLGRWDVDAFAGRSLARGLRDPENTALRGIDDFVPDQGLYLFGGSVGARVGVNAATVRYQRELLADRSGLGSERASFQGSSVVRDVRLDAGGDWDFGRGQPGKAHLTASTMFGSRWTVSAEAMRYVPYFSLSTIWGFFEPVAYHEARARVAWSASSRLGLWGTGGVRRYGDTETTVVLRALEDVGRRGEVGAVLQISQEWTARAGYQLEWGPGGFLSSGDASTRWVIGPTLAVTANAMSFQQIEQYRLGDGRAWGGGLAVDLTLTDRFTFSGGGSMLRHGSDPNPWNQTRAWSTIRARLGSDPGMRNRVRR